MAGAVLLTFLPVLYAMMNAADAFTNSVPPDVSQVPSFLDIPEENQEADQGTDPRVGWSTTSHVHADALRLWAKQRTGLIVTADPDHRYSGVAMAISARVCCSTDITFCSWIPGRLLHVKCEGQLVTLDLVGVCQWDRQDDKKAGTDSKRHLLWTQMGRLMIKLPRRNLLVHLVDFNTPVEHLAGHVGRGVLASRTRGADEDLQQLLQVHGLVMLNTWKRAGPTHTATFLNGDVCTQIDFAAVRKEAADRLAREAAPTALNLAPWRLGPRHGPAVATVPWVAGWRLRHLKTGKHSHLVPFSMRGVGKGRPCLPCAARSSKSFRSQRLKRALMCSMPSWCRSANVCSLLPRVDPIGLADNLGFLLEL